MLKAINHRAYSYYLLFIGGFVYCLISALGKNNAFCVTEGCNVYNTYTFMGLNLYWLGTIFFASIFFLYVTRKNGYYKKAVLYAVYAEISLLLYQAVFLPCSSCLIVALFIGALFVSSYDLRNRYKYLVIILGCLFLVNTGFALKEQIRPWSIYESGNADTKIFFSATCPACKKMLSNVLEKEGENIALYPIAKNGKDYKRLAILKCNLKNNNLMEALRTCWQGKQGQEFSLWDRVELWWNLWRNKIYLIRLNQKNIPVLMTNDTYLFKKNNKNSLASNDNENLNFLKTENSFKENSETCSDSYCTF